MQTSTVSRPATYPSLPQGQRVSGTASPDDIPLTPDNLLFLQRTVGNRAVVQLLQRKATLSQPGDAYELEANRVAEQVTSEPSPTSVNRKVMTPQISRVAVQGNGLDHQTELPFQPIDKEQRKRPEEENGLQMKLTEGAGFLQRQMMGEGEEDRKRRKGEEKIQAKEEAGQTPAVTSEVESQIESLFGGGEPLPESVRAFAEPRFGRDFSKVRVHADTKAADVAGQLNAEAFTKGNDIYFSAGRYSPATDKGKHLLAHELTHTIQQGEGASTALLQRSAESDLIGSHTSWGNLDEARLGNTLLLRARQGDHAFVLRVLDELGSTDRDDVSFALANAASEVDLSQLSQSDSGRRLLDRLYDELTAGSVADEEMLQANRILQVKSRIISPQQFQQNVQTAKIFPYRLPGLTVLNDAPISAQRREGGRIWVKLPVRVLGTDLFRAETRTLPADVFIGGMELPENEIIGVKMYDLGGEIHYRPALYLVQLANETNTTVLTKMGEAAGLGLTLGTGALAGLGVRASMAARVLLWADRAAFALGTITSVIREHRGWILQRFGDSGKNFLRYVDIVNSAVMIYGGARVVIGMGQLINGLRVSYQNWRTAVRAAEAELSSSEQTAVQQVSQQTDDVLQNADQIGSARQPAVGEPEPGTAATQSPATPNADRPSGGTGPTTPVVVPRPPHAIDLAGQEALGGHSLERHSSQVSLSELRDRVLGNHPTMPQSRTAMKFTNGHTHAEAVNQAYLRFQAEIEQHFASGGGYREWTLEYGSQTGVGFTNTGTRGNPVLQSVTSEKVTLSFDRHPTASGGFYLVSAFPAWP